MSKIKDSVYNISVWYGCFEVFIGNLIAFVLILMLGGEPPIDIHGNELNVLDWWFWNFWMIKWVATLPFQYMAFKDSGY